MRLLQRMVKRIQISIGPRTRKAIRALANQNEAETGFQLTELKVMETAARIGLALMLKGQKIQLPEIPTLRD